ncbi:MAG: pyridoxamine 5'-phosphate oxidase family protein [Treponema sp.]|nr:pyridoxamine 5'-phosphate oxidase family protein [Treponema sp.]
MRRKNREIQSIESMMEIIEKCKHCRIGLSVDNNPYIVPLNYGYSYQNNKLTLYFHSAKEGKKIDIININNKACFEIDCDTKLIEGEIACKYGYEYKSIIGFGKIIILETDKEKIEGLNKLMEHQTGKNVNYTFTEDELKKVLVYKMEVNEFTGKER